MRKLLAIWVAKVLMVAGKIAGKNGSSVPGGIALKICPDILQKLSQQIPSKNIVAVCGTNGKTTTNNLIYSILTSQGKKVVCNNVGSNMVMGVTTAFIKCADIFGRVKADYATLEIDEVSTRHVFKQMKPGFMIVTNFFRDQLDRYGEVDITMSAMREALDMTHDTKLILNGDDPLVTWFGTGRECYFYGIGEEVLEQNTEEIREGRFCKVCGSVLEYEYYHYSQLGKYTCPECGFAHPQVDFEATNVNVQNGIAFDVNGNRIKVNYRGFYNIYNILAAYGATTLMGINNEDINKVLGAYKPQAGRMESFSIGKDVILNLSKNTAGFNQAIAAMLEDTRKKDMLFVINDNAPDGCDITWIWDVDYESMQGNVENLGASGKRYKDLVLRYKYGGFDMSNVKGYDSIEQAIKDMLKTDSEVLYVLVSYTALFGTQEILKKLESEAKGADNK
ncbi:MAG: MurT ligase domain-containing protein [Eubacteriales bacterium]|nr:MurT ligase domain-containing protein [Eubacteriales bacterium]